MREVCMSRRTFWLAGCGIAILACSAAPSRDEGALSASDSLTSEEADDDSSDFSSLRSQQGLAITPVALNLDGKSSDEVARIGYGSYIVNAVASCTDCHTNPANPRFLAGGRKFSLDTAGHFVWSRNL